MKREGNCGGSENSRCKGPWWTEALYGRETKAGPHMWCSTHHKFLINIKRENDSKGAEGLIKQCIKGEGWTETHKEGVC
jgi:hypothetical protein